MNILVTAGNTLVPIDRVRCITNIFTGRTGAQIALEAHQRGHHVTLLTSHPDVVGELHDTASPLTERWSLRRYRTFDDLQTLMAKLISPTLLDVVIHSAAVSDYHSGGIYAAARGTRFDGEAKHWEGSPPTMTDMAAGKVKSDAPELWLRLVRAPKLVDMVRQDWGFRGMLVKFKLEVDVPDDKLLEIAERSREQSMADLMVANTLEGASYWAYLGPLEQGYQRIFRRELAGKLLDAVEQHHRERGHG